jgi:hypothetical protein
MTGYFRITQRRARRLTGRVKLILSDIAYGHLSPRGHRGYSAWQG